MNAAILISLVLILGGCSEKVWYDTAENSLHNQAKHNCYGIPNPEERRACEAQHSRPYDERR